MIPGGDFGPGVAPPDAPIWNQPVPVLGVPDLTPAPMRNARVPRYTCTKCSKEHFGGGDFAELCVECLWTQHDKAREEADATLGALRVRPSAGNAAGAVVADAVARVLKEAVPHAEEAWWHYCDKLGAGTAPTSPAVDENLTRSQKRVLRIAHQLFLLQCDIQDERSGGES